MILIQERYSSPDPRRAAELARARALNEAAGLFTAFDPAEGGGRRSFADLFGRAAARHAGEVCVVANADISFDDSLRVAADLVRQAPAPLLVALTRWDDDAGPSMEGRVDAATRTFFSHSQDAWVFVAGGLPRFEAGFTLGLPACENRLAYEAAAAGIAVADPALSVRIRHHHASAVRTWKLADGYRGPLLFPRLVTAAARNWDAYVLERRGWRSRRGVVRLEGDFADRVAGLPGAGGPRF